MHSSRHMIRFAIAAIALSSPSAYAQGYVNFVRQQQQTTKITWDMPVAQQGAAPATLTSEDGGALFQLWTVSQKDSKDYLLDQKLVGAYLPKGAITIRSADSYNGIPRIRADQPFTVEFTVSNLLTGQNLPLSATTVLAEHHLAPNPGGNAVITAAQAIADTPFSSGYISANGLTKVMYPVTSIKAADPTKARGEEHFVLHALGDGTFTQTQIATAFIKVWPMASGKISGLDPGTLIRTNPPVLTVKLDDLYPRSNTFIRISSDGPLLGKGGTVIAGSMLALDQELPVSRLLTVSDYGNLFDSDGAYVIELLTTTPFGTDVLDRIPFQVNRTIRVNAMMVDYETPEN